MSDARATGPSWGRDDGAALHGESYLWLKLAGDGSISGSRMPLDPLASGSRSLPQDQLDSIQTWILAGALND